MLRHILPAAFLALLPSAAFAQQTDRRARDEPEIVVEAGGRVGTADALLFSPDGRFLLAGGDDKVVRVWPHSAAGLDSKGQTLRWRAWREQRGGIKAVAISPDGKRVALGGYGMKPSTVAIVDRETGEPLGLTWPRSRPASIPSARSPPSLFTRRASGSVSARRTAACGCGNPNRWRNPIATAGRRTFPSGPASTRRAATSRGSSPSSTSRA